MGPIDPSIGQEVQKTSPAVIVSNDVANRVLKRYLVVWLTSQTQRVYPGEALIYLNGVQRKAMTDQLTTANVLRFSLRIGTLSAGDMVSLEGQLLIQLGLISMFQPDRNDEDPQ